MSDQQKMQRRLDEIRGQMERGERLSPDDIRWLFEVINGLIYAIGVLGRTL